MLMLEFAIYPLVVFASMAPFAFRTHDICTPAPSSDDVQVSIVYLFVKHIAGVLSSATSKLSARLHNGLIFDWTAFV